MRTSKTTRHASAAAIVAVAVALVAAAGTAAAGAPKPTAPKENVEIEVVPTVLEGQVKLVLPGREGDAVFVDDWPAGSLPVVAFLAEGPHVFRIEGASGKTLVETFVTIAPGKIPELDLSKVSPPAPAPAPTPTPAPAPKPAPTP